MQMACPLCDTLSMSVTVALQHSLSGRHLSAVRARLQEVMAPLPFPTTTHTHPIPSPPPKGWLLTLQSPEQ